MALRMRAAFHLANLIFCKVSASGVPHSCVRSKKVAAASNVSAVCLHTMVSQGTASRALRRRQGAQDVPRHLVGPQRALGAVKGLVRKVLDVGLARIVVDDGVVVCVLGLGGLEALDERLGEGEAVVVGGVQALAYDLVDGMVLAYKRIARSVSACFTYTEDAASRRRARETHTSRQWRA